MTQGIFITGTDTGVGKTIFSAALAKVLTLRGVNVGVMKPVTSGCERRNGELYSEDAELLAFGAGIEVTSDVAPYLLSEPIAPSAAAEMEKTRIEFSRILAAYHRLCEQYDYVIVEGAGGLMVPLAGGLLVADLISHLALPLLVVARPNLGTVNHTTLTCFVAKNMGLDLRGVVVNNFPQNPTTAESTAPHLIDSLCGAPLLGRIPAITATSHEELVERVASVMIANPATRIMLREIGIE